MENRFDMEFTGISENEAFARTVVSAFAAMLDPTVEELAELKTAVSEAVTNAIVHGYEEREGKVYMKCDIEGNVLTIVIQDKGVGIEDVALARQSMFTSKAEDERAGMGFMFMEIFMDFIDVWSKPKEGTIVTMKKVIGAKC